jgi:voltage-gated potassium channel
MLRPPQKRHPGRDARLPVIKGSLQRRHAPSQAPWRHRLYIIIFEAETPAGRRFDIALLILIVLSILIVSLESVADVESSSGHILLVIEWLLTLIFTAEYVLRLLCVDKPLRYATSTFGLVDLLSIVPTYLSLFFTGAQSLLVIRTLRLLRMFRIFKLANFLTAGQSLLAALRASRSKISVFLLAVINMVVIVGTAMYLIEGDADSGFTSIPRAMYWAIVTMTTVGYGDIAPKTPLGQLIASMLMIAGYAIIAVPTGIVSAEMVLHHDPVYTSTRTCPRCTLEGHDPDAHYCRSCGGHLAEPEPSPAPAPAPPDDR